MDRLSEWQAAIALRDDALIQLAFIAAAFTVSYLLVEQLPERWRSAARSLYWLAAIIVFYTTLYVVFAVGVST
jgi:hypothetical protein